MRQFIYADNAATTKLDKDVLAVMLPWLSEDYGNASQPYFFAVKSKKALADARKVIAECIGAQPNEIYFTSGGTESDNWAIKGVLSSAVITSLIEHHAIINSCKKVEKKKPVFYLNTDECGYLFPDVLCSAVNRQNMLVSMMMVNNEIGTIEPIKELAKIAHEKGCVFHTDAVQAVGHLKIDVKELDVDLLSASAHKFNGPKGIGFLYVKNGIKIDSLIDGGVQENGFRAGTENVAAVVGMAKALELNCSNIENNTRHLKNLEKILLGRLSAYEIDYRRNGANQIPGNLSLSFKGMDGEMLLHRLDLMGVMVSTGSACDGSKNQISHVIRAIGVPAEYAKGTIRISLAADNSEKEMIYIADSLSKIIRS